MNTDGTPAAELVLVHDDAQRAAARDRTQTSWEQAASMVGLLGALERPVVAARPARRRRRKVARATEGATRTCLKPWTRGVTRYPPAGRTWAWVIGHGPAGPLLTARWSLITDAKFAGFYLVRPLALHAAGRRSRAIPAPWPPRRGRGPCPGPATRAVAAVASDPATWCSTAGGVPVVSAACGWRRGGRGSARRLAPTITPAHARATVRPWRALAEVAEQGEVAARDRLAEADTRVDPDLGQHRPRGAWRAWGSRTKADTSATMSS